MLIREERPEEAATIAEVTRAAFATLAVSQQTEAAIVAALRAAGALTHSLVALDSPAGAEAGKAVELVGHAAFSAVGIGAETSGWYGLGPISVRPDRQRQGIGGALLRDGLARLAATGARGVVLVGDPGYYSRFGFAHPPGLTHGTVPDQYVMALVLDGGAPPVGEITFHPGFDAR